MSTAPDLDLVEGDLAPRRPLVTPGHEIVEIVDGGYADHTVVDEGFAYRLFPQLPDEQAPPSSATGPCFGAAVLHHS